MTPRAMVTWSELNTIGGNHDSTFAEVVQGLMAGDFSWLDPLFRSPADGAADSNHPMGGRQIV